MLKIQELPGTMPLDPHGDSAPRSRGTRSAAIEGLLPRKCPLWPVKCQQRFMPRGLWPYEVCGTTDLINVQNHPSVLIQSAIHHLVFKAGALGARVSRMSAFRAPARKTE